MDRKRNKRIASLTAEVDSFNAQVPVGTLVAYWRGARAGEPSGRGKIHHAATIIGNHTAVTWIEGCSGAIALTHVQVLDESLAQSGDTTSGTQQTPADPDDSAGNRSPHLR